MIYTFERESAFKTYVDQLFQKQLFQNDRGLRIWILVLIC